MDGRTATVQHGGMQLEQCVCRRLRPEGRGRSCYLTWILEFIVSEMGATGGFSRMEPMVVVVYPQLLGIPCLFHEQRPVFQCKP